MLESPFPLPDRAQCPFCAAIFSPSLPPRAAHEPPPPPPQYSESPFAPPSAPYSAARPSVQASDQVRTPAVGLMIGGILSLVYAALDLVACIHFIIGFQQGQPPPNWPPFMQNLMQPNATQMTIAAILDAVKLLWCAAIIYGALKMMRLESYALAIAASVMSLILCMNCCCFLGLPFGIWSLIVLNRPEVRASFR
jgi:hypothetical protein